MTTVFVTGIFDLLHIEHVRFLKAAKKVTSDKRQATSKGTYLVVGIESDMRVRTLKGSGRPIMSEKDRKEMLEALSCVDEAMILPERFDTDKAYEKILRDVRADIYAVSSESPYLENKKRICEKVGVQCKIVHRYNPDYSTTKLIERVCS